MNLTQIHLKTWSERNASKFSNNTWLLQEKKTYKYRIKMEPAPPSFKDPEYINIQTLLGTGCLLLMSQIILVGPPLKIRSAQRKCALSVAVDENVPLVSNSSDASFDTVELSRSSVGTGTQLWLEGCFKVSVAILKDPVCLTSGDFTSEQHKGRLHEATGWNIHLLLHLKVKSDQKAFKYWCHLLKALLFWEL